MSDPFLIPYFFKDELYILRWSEQLSLRRCCIQLEKNVVQLDGK